MVGTEHKSSEMMIDRYIDHPEMIGKDQESQESQRDWRGGEGLNSPGSVTNLGLISVSLKISHLIGSPALPGP